MNIISSTDVRNASHANKVRLKIIIDKNGRTCFENIPWNICQLCWQYIWHSEKRQKAVITWKSCGLTYCLLAEYAEKCTATTNANCSCHSGFLCSNNICSKCEENKCAAGYKPMRTGKNGHTFELKEISCDCSLLLVTDLVWLFEYVNYCFVGYDCGCGLVGVKVHEYVARETNVGYTQLYCRLIWEM